MAEGFIHTVYRFGRWFNEVEGAEHESNSHETKEQAVFVGRRMAQHARTQHVIHEQDGTVAERNWYGDDPGSRPV